MLHSRALQSLGGVLCTSCGWRIFSICIIYTIMITELDHEFQMDFLSIPKPQDAAVKLRARMVLYAALFGGVEAAGIPAS